MNDPSPEKLEALLNGPALDPPAGIIPQLDNPPGHRITSIVIPAFCLIASTALVAMRLYTRIKIIRRVDIADYSLFLGWVIFIGEIVCAFLAVKHAPGVHQWNVRLKDLGPFLYYFHVASILYGICIFFVKFTILMQYITIFMPIKKPKALYWTTIFAIAVNFIHYFIGRFMEIFSCQPIAKAWDPLITGGSCIDIKALISASTSINAASDIIILILPQVVIWRLNLSWKEKAGISIIFLIAIFACVSSIICIFYSVILQRQSDDTYYTWLTGVWTLLESVAGFAVACLPVAKAFVKNLSKIGGSSGIASSTSKVTSQSMLPSYRSNLRYELESQESDPATNPNHDNPSFKIHGVAGLTGLRDLNSARNHRMNDPEAPFEQVFGGSPLSAKSLLDSL